jgi:hypothetical protein
MPKHSAILKRGTSILAAAAIVITGSLSGFAPASMAHANPVKVSRQVGVPLQEATALAQAGDNKGALAKLDAAEAAATTPQERYQISSVRRYIYVQTKAYPKLAAVLETQLASGLMPDTEVKTVRRELIQIYDRAGDLTKAISAAKNFVSTYGHDKDLTIYIAAKALETKDYKAASIWANKAIEGERAASRTPPETWYRIRMKSAYEAKDMASYYAAIEDVVKVYPNETYWRALIGKAHAATGYSPERLELDEFRVLQAAGVKLTTEEKLGMAESAFERELSAEALSILQPMEKAGELSADASKAARNQRLLDKAKTDTEADRKALAAIVAEATRKGDAQALANVAEMTLSFGDAKGAASLYQTALAKPGLDAATASTARLRLGIAQFRSGDVAGAKKTWASIKATDGTEDIAKTWQLVAAKS